MTIRVAPRIVAIVPAYNCAGTIARTIMSLVDSERIDEVVVVDDGSVDETAMFAQAAGARVIRLSANHGKGYALSVGVDAASYADVYLFVDGDTSESAANVAPLIDPVLVGDSDMTIGVLPPAGTRGGFGAIKRFSRWAIRKATGRTFQAPLSGQRAIRGDLARQLTFASRFGVEVAMTIDVVELGGFVRELPIAVEHDHTGRTFRGFVHRGRQGFQILRVVWPRITSARYRHVLTSMLALAIIAAMFFSNANNKVQNEARDGRVSHVVLFSMPTLEFSDLSNTDLPYLHQLVQQGAVAGTSIRAGRPNPVLAEEFASVSAGAKVNVVDSSINGFNAKEPYQGSTAQAATEARTGRQNAAAVVVPNIVSIRREAEKVSASSLPGSIGKAVRAAGYRTMALGNGDYYTDDGAVVLNRPAPMIVADDGGGVDFGTVSGQVNQKLEDAPFNTQANNDVLANAFSNSANQAQVISVDSGDLLRAREARRSVTPEIADQYRRDALKRTDALLGRLLSTRPSQTLFIVYSPLPTSATAELTPMVMSGPGVFAGRLYSTSTQQQGLVALTDIAPTVLDALRLPAVKEMEGNVLRLQPGSQDIDAIAKLSGMASNRDRIYASVTRVLVVGMALALGYLIFALDRRRRSPGAQPLASLPWLLVSALPLASMLMALLPINDLEPAGFVVLLVATTLLCAFIARLVTDSAYASMRLLALLAFITIVVSVCTGGAAIGGTIFGNSPLIGARFRGLGNLTFAVLACSVILYTGTMMERAERKRDAWWIAFWMFVVALIADAAPGLGADVGGMLAFTPVAVLLLWRYSQRRITARTIVWVVVISAAVIGAVLAIDMLRPTSAQSHFARFVNEFFTDNSGSSLLHRKISRISGSFSSIWMWMIPIGAAYLWLLSYPPSGWNRSTPLFGLFRSTVFGIVAVGLLGMAVNDSGAGILGMAAIYMCSLLALRALEDQREEMVSVDTPRLVSAREELDTREEVLL